MSADIYGTLNPGTRGQHKAGSVHHGNGREESVHHRRRQLLKDFSYRMKLLLTASDQDYLLSALKEYQMYSQLDKLILCLKAVLDTPAKLDLLKDVRHFMSNTQVMAYDSMVPYHKMAHPWQLSEVGTMPRSRARRVNVLPTPQRTPKMQPKIVNGSTEVLASESAPIKVVTLVKAESDPLGFSIRGGSEHGLGIFVSEVEPETAAEYAGLEAGDNIIEVNSVSFDNLASSSAVKVLTGSLRLKMIVRRINKIPGFKSAKEKISWYNVAQNNITEGDIAEHGTFHDPADSRYVDSTDRHVNLRGYKNGHHFLGFNIRGGSEYGLGIYVSKVDVGGLAEVCGLKVGDQILEVNGHSFHKVTHAQAVDAVQSQKQLILTVRDIGMYPAFKEIYAEYQWLDTLTGQVTKTRSTGHISSVPVRSSPHHGATHQYTEFPPESRVESYAQTDDESEDELELVVPISHPMDVGIQTNSDRDSPTNLVPKRKDIELRHRQPDEKLNSRNRHRDEPPPRPTLAVRAMELEARRKYPELAEEWDLLTPDERQARLYSRDDFDLDLGENGSRSKSFKDFMFFGSKSKGGRVKSSTQGAKPSKNRNRKPLSNLNFMKKSDSDKADMEDVSCFEYGMDLKDCINTSSNKLIVEQSARALLVNEDEITALVRHVKIYEKEKKLDELLRPLLAILDTHEKLQLLRDIRCVIQPADLADYDRTVVNQEQLCLRQQALKQSPHRQLSPRQLSPGEQLSPRQQSPGEHLSPRQQSPGQHLSPGQSGQNYQDINSDVTNRKPLYKSTRQEAYKQQIEAQQRHLLDEEKRKFSEIHLRHSEHGSPLAPDVEEIVVPDAPDAKYNYEIHRYKSNSRVYKGDHGPEGVNRDKSDLRSEAEGNFRVYNRDHEVLNQDKSNPRGEAEKRMSSGVFMEDIDSHHYHTIADMSKVSSTHSPSLQDSGIGGSVSSNSRTNVSRSSPSPLVSPVYATVKKGGRGKVKAEAQQDGAYIDSTDLYAVYESVDLPEADTQHLHQVAATKSGPRTPDDYWDSQSETYQEAKMALSFLDGLDGDDEEDEVVLTSSKPRSTSWSSLPDTPRSEVSSINGSRFGSYDVNTSLSGSPKDEDGPFSLDRSPPRFVPPPPPDDSPPSDSPRSENDFTAENDAFVSGVKYTKRQTSYDHHGDSLRASLGRAAGFRTGEHNKEHAISLGDVLQNSLSSQTNQSSSSRTLNKTGTSAPNVASVAEPSTKSTFMIRPRVNSPHEELVTNFGSAENLYDSDPSTMKVTLRKTHASLGFSISGGIDSKSQPEIKVDKVFPGGAAAAQGDLKAGMTIESINGHSLVAVTHQQAVDIIRKTFSSKQPPTMNLVLKRPLKL